MFPISLPALVILAILLGVAAATAVWLLRGRDCDWYETAAMGICGGFMGALVVMFVMPMTDAAFPYPLNPVFIASAIGAVFCQFAFYYRRSRRL